ncbi:MAG: KOW domain-containing RNA-binding protein, partial [Rikenellaceae bacterium]
VKSAFGRDKDRYFVVVKSDGDFVFLVDGKVRKLLSPKKKRTKHVIITNDVVVLSDLKTDKQFRNVLSRLNNSQNQS